MDLSVPKVISIWEAYGVLIDLWLHDDVDLVGRNLRSRSKSESSREGTGGGHEAEDMSGSSQGLVREELDRERSVVGNSW